MANSSPRIFQTGEASKSIQTSDLQIVDSQKKNPRIRFEGGIFAGYTGQKHDKTRWLQGFTIDAGYFAEVAVNGAKQWGSVSLPSGVALDENTEWGTLRTGALYKDAPQSKYYFDPQIPAGRKFGWGSVESKGNYSWIFDMARAPESYLEAKDPRAEKVTGIIDDYAKKAGHQALGNRYFRVRFDAFLVTDENRPQVLARVTWIRYAATLPPLVGDLGFPNPGKNNIMVVETSSEFAASRQPYDKNTRTEFDRVFGLNLVWP